MGKAAVKDPTTKVFKDITGSELLKQRFAEVGRDRIAHEVLGARKAEDPVKAALRSVDGGRRTLELRSQFADGVAAYTRKGIPAPTVRRAVEAIVEEQLENISEKGDPEWQRIKKGGKTAVEGFKMELRVAAVAKEDVVRPLAKAIGSNDQADARKALQMALTQSERESQERVKGDRVKAERERVDNVLKGFTPRQRKAMRETSELLTQLESRKGEDAYYSKEHLEIAKKALNEGIILPAAYILEGEIASAGTVGDRVREDKLNHLRTRLVYGQPRVGVDLGKAKEAFKGLEETGFILPKDATRIKISLGVGQDQHAKKFFTDRGGEYSRDGSEYMLREGGGYFDYFVDDYGNPGGLGELTTMTGKNFLNLMKAHDALFGGKRSWIPNK